MTTASTSPGLVLASASPRRRDLLARLGVRFVVRPTDVDETPPAGLGPSEVAAALALRKARACPAADDELVLGADTVVAAADGELLGKPSDDRDARRILGKLSGTTHRVITGYALVRRAPGLECTGSVETRVTMRALEPDEIATYVATGESEGKAGAYAIQERGDRFVTRVEGSWSNVVGLPLEQVRARLTELGLLAEALP